MSTRIAGLLVGIVFGVILCWSGMSDPDVIRGALTFQSAYLFLFFGAAVVTATVGLQVLKRVQPKALLTGVPVRWTEARPERRHVVGSLLFGAGWGVADACPGPILAQVGQGALPWAAFTLAGAIVGVYIYLRRENVETEPASDAAPAAASAA